MAVDDKIKVAVRVRPFNKREKALGTKCAVEMDKNQTILHHPDEQELNKQPKSFGFDHCFNSINPTLSNFAEQEDVFNLLGKDILDNAFKGYNACIFAYGQTGSGKSYSMMGSQEQPGIIPRLCVNLFERIANVSTPENEATVEVSYMEIYNEKVHDLLDLTAGNKSGLKVREHHILGPYVDGLSQLAVVSYQEIEDLMIEGNKSRTVAATNMNNESSRSHAVFTIILTFTLKDPISGVSGEKVSRMSLVDLAGSERAVKTGAVGERLKEGSNINKSLTTLGLVISKLAEQSGAKGKDKFVPYRDSTLTWLLKDNLGGNSRTVMVATLSPSMDNYEETLSTLRYADRAKKIVNHAVVNEDPNARIIRELRAEVDALKEMLLHAAQPEVLKEKLCENEKLMKEMSLTWDEKLYKTEQKQEDRRNALEKMGISVESSGIKVEKNKYFLVNLNADPSLNELLVYYLNKKTLVGRNDASPPQDIQLSGLGIQSQHCFFEIEENEIFITPLAGARTCVNGREIVCKTLLKNGDRLLWGSNHFFRLNCPKVSPDTPLTPFDWRMAQEEVMMAETTYAPMKEAIARIEKQYEEDKLKALEHQKKEFEKQFVQLKYMMSPTANTESFIPYDMRTSRRSNKYERLKSMDETYKQGMSELREDIIRANGMVREANLLAEEVGNLARFSVTLQIPPHNLTPNRKRGSFISEAAILVKNKDLGSQVWSLDKLEHKLIDMREVYQDLRDNNIDLASELVNPFYEEHENYQLIGVANIFLDVLFHDVKLTYETPIISQQGDVAGRLHVEIERSSGSFPKDREGGCETNSEDSISSSQGSDDLSAPTITCRIAIKSASGISPLYSQFVFCNYSFWGDQEHITVKPTADPHTQSNKPQIGIQSNIKFNHTREITIQVTEEFIDHCFEGAISIEVFGFRIEKLSPWENNLHLTKAESLADRWRELTKKLELRVDFQELNDAGEYSPVEVHQKDEDGAGGVFQLRQGQQRRIGVLVKPVPNSGMLPLICDSIVSIEIGSLCMRSKLQKPLDSYQEEDLSRLRERWSEALERRRCYLDAQMQMYMNKPDKNETEQEREQSLVEQWVHLTEERNAILVPSENSGVPGAPSSSEYSSAPGIELHSPVLFLDLNSSDFSEDSTEFEDDEPPLYGHNSILPKEHGERFFSLPIIRYLNQDVGAVASWDSSIHESIYLNKLTDANERAYMIVKVVVRLSHPTPMDLVLRKRICFNIFKRQSLTDQIRRRIGYASSPEYTGVIYEVVSNVPKASEQLEDRESLAAMAASGQDDVAVDGETFIEKYTKGANAVDEILRMEKIRQSVAIKEILVVRNKNLTPVQSMRKTLSVPNISNGMRNSFSLDNVSGLRLKSSETFQELSLELSGRSPRSFASTHSNEYSQSLSNRNSGLKRLPMSMTMSTLHEDRNQVQDVDFGSGPNQMSNLDHNAGSQQTCSRQLRKSQTSGNISNLSSDSNNTTSPVSSGYESQTVSCTTLSRESSLDPDETIDQDYSKGGNYVGELTEKSNVSSDSMSTGNLQDKNTMKNRDETSNLEFSLSASLNISSSSDRLSVREESSDGSGKTSPQPQTLPDWLVVGESVQIRPSNTSGVVRFIGKTDFAPGNWVGVELDTSQGKNDGSVGDKRYFTCSPRKGMFVKPKNLKLDKRGREMRLRKQTQ